MENDARKLLYDIASSAKAIREFCQGHTREDYESDLLLRSACARQLGILGEATARLRDRHPDAFGGIKEGPAIIGFRNRLIHGYDAVDAEIAWDVIVNKLPGLKANGGSVARLRMIGAALMLNGESRRGRRSHSAGFFFSPNAKALRGPPKDFWGKLEHDAHA